MSNTPTQPAFNGAWPNLPLPGFYPCLTAQVNLTLHPAQRTGKFVVVVREPNDQLEIFRTLQGVSPAEQTLDAFGTRMLELGGLLKYLSGWETPTA